MNNRPSASVHSLNKESKKQRIKYLIVRNIFFVWEFAAFLNFMLSLIE